MMLQMLRFCVKMSNSLVNGRIFSKTTKFSLNRNTGRIEWRRIDRVERSTALRVCVVVVVVEVTGAMIIPATGRINEPCRIKRAHDIGECELRVVALGDLAPAFIVDDPRDDAGIAAVLADEDFKLALELLLLIGVWQNCFDCAVIKSLTLRRTQRRHVLD